MKIPRILLKGSRDATWVDPVSTQAVYGKEFFYLVQDELSGEWLFRVRVPNGGNKIIVNAIESSRADILCDQIKRKAIVFIRVGHSGTYYHPLSIAHVDGYRIYFKRPRRNKDVPNFIIERFEVGTYRDIMHKNKPGFDVVVFVPRDMYEKMVELFILENIWPVFVSDFPAKKSRTVDISLLEGFLREQGLLVIGKYENQLEVWDGLDFAKIGANAEVVSCSSKQGKKRFEKLLRLYFLLSKLSSTRKENEG